MRSDAITAVTIAFLAAGCGPKVVKSFGKQEIGLGCSRTSGLVVIHLDLKTPTATAPAEEGARDWIERVRIVLPMGATGRIGIVDASWCIATTPGVEPDCQRTEHGEVEVAEYREGEATHGFYRLRFGDRELGGRFQANWRGDREVTCR